MYGKLLIKCQLRVLTGLHIGSSQAFAAIGAVDNPVIRDLKTKQPIVPGSSLKGKLRTLLARSLAGDITKLPDHNGDDIKILRLFGSSKEPITKARLQFSDSFVSNADTFGEIPLTEVKYENAINRLTSEANPRPIERVVSGVCFDVNIVYDVFCENPNEDKELLEDMRLLAKAMRLLQLDYLGGHGTRGSGRVSFDSIKLCPLEFKLEDSVKEKLQPMFKDVENYELLSI